MLSAMSDTEYVDDARVLSQDPLSKLTISVSFTQICRSSTKPFASGTAINRGC